MDGISIGFKGPEKQVIKNNWPSAIVHSDAVTQFIQDNLQMGKITGPLKQLPPGFRSSPLGAFIRNNTQKIRVIHDLSWPPGGSVNDYINSKDYTLSYVTVDLAANNCLIYPEPWLIKMDLQAAFLSCPVKESDRHLLGFQWTNGDGVTEYFHYNVLCFGLKSSPKNFDLLATALQYIMVSRGVPGTVIHYLDDYFCSCASELEAKTALDIMVKTATEAGFDVQPSKTLGPSRILEFLGVEINTVNNTLSISSERMQEINDLVSEWLEKPEGTKRQLLSLIGKLSFCARVVRSGNKFIRRLINLSKKVRNLHHLVKVTAQARADLTWWSRCLTSHNGVTWLDLDWNTADAIYCHTDASDLAAAALFKKSWTVWEFKDSSAWMKATNIAWREMFAVVLCLAVFGPRMSNKMVKMYIDNQAVIHCINTGTCKDEAIMSLIRALYYYITIYQINYRAYYVSSLDNAYSDSLSRLQYQRFNQLCPWADPIMTEPCHILLDF